MKLLRISLFLAIVITVVLLSVFSININSHIARLAGKTDKSDIDAACLEYMIKHDPNNWAEPNPCIELNETPAR